MLSMYTNNPMNLAINAPSGDGKNYILQKVGELFPENDVIFLAGLSEKTLYHRNGLLVIKNETGQYELVDDILRKNMSKSKTRKAKSVPLTIMT